MKLQFPAGSDVALVEITGNRKNNEPAHVRISFPGGDVEVVRAKDGDDADYWVHLRVNRPSDGGNIPGETDLARVIDARIDARNTGNGSSHQDAKVFENPEIYHVALRVKREALIQ